VCEAIVKPEPESEKEERDRAPMGTWTKFWIRGKRKKQRCSYPHL